jgi:hypothetical protein
MIVVSCTPFLTAQELASLTGVVTDSSGAVIPAVSVKLEDTKTNASYEAKTNSAGGYTFVKVLPGPGYKLTFTREGFDTLTVSKIYIGVGAANTQNAQMQIGKVTETVEVSASSQPVTLNTTDATIGTNFDMHTVHELPIANRDSPAALLLLQPGVTNGPTADGNGSRDGAITGARTDQTNITLDGLDVNDFATGQTFATVGNAPVDSIQEFHEEVANPLAASGRGSGAQVQLVTQSGSNSWHGGLYEYHRNTVTEANNIFNATAGLPTPKLIRNQFGAKIGGPVIKDKLFFFFNYQGRRDAQESSVLATVPLDSMRAGNISYINNNPGCDEDSRINTTPSCISVLPNTGGTQNQTTLDPAGVGNNAALLSFINGRYPRANDLTRGDGINTGGFRFNAPVGRTANDYVARVDYNMTEKNKLFSRFSILRDTSGDNVNFAAPFQFPGDPVTHQIVDHSYAYVIGDTWTISPTKVNNFYYGETRSQLGFPTTFTPTGINYFNAFGPITAPFSNPESQNRIVPVPVFRDDFTWVHNKHNFEMGGTFKPIKTRSIQVNDFNFISLGISTTLPNLDLSQEPTNLLGRDSSDATVPADAIAAQLWDSAYAFGLGRFGAVGSNFNNGQDLAPLPQGTGHRRDYRYYETEVYFQDTWRVRSDLTLTYGLRYQYYSVPYEVAGLEAVPDQTLAQFFDPRAAGAAAGSFDTLPNTTYNLGGKANHGPGLYAPDHKDFAPRLAFSYNPGSSKGWLNHLFGDRKTVIRGGGGLVFDHPVTNALNFIQDQATYIFQNSTANNEPGDLATDDRFTDINTIPSVIVPPPATAPFTPFLDGGGNAVGTVNNQINYAIDPTLKTPYSIVYTFGIQRELPSNFLFEANYVGRGGRRLLAQSDAGQVTDFKDTASGHFLAEDFADLTKQVRAGVDAAHITPAPFFESQIGTGASAFLVDNVSSLIGRGDLGDFVQLLQIFNFLAPNVGLHPQFASDVYITNKAYSSYNGLLATLRHRMSHGLQFDFHYTYSHSIDNISAPANNVFGTANDAGGIICDITDLKKCRGDSDFDVRHIITGDYIYELPFGHGKQFGNNAPGWLNQIFGGWQVAGTFNWLSGFAYTTVSNAFPTSFLLNSPATFIGTQSDIAVGVHQDASGAFQMFKDPSRALGAFRGPLGLEGGTRNNLRGPAFTQFDMGLAKHFPIGEKYVVEFRADAFNVFNHVNFGLPAAGGGGTGGTADITAPGSFGVITSAGAPRQMQFALRLDF